LSTIPTVFFDIYPRVYIKKLLNNACEVIFLQGLTEQSAIQGSHLKT